MENKSQLLKKMGYSKQYLKLLEKVININQYGRENSPNNIGKPQFFDTKFTTLIIENSEKPMKNNFIYNEE